MLTLILFAISGTLGFALVLTLASNLRSTTNRTWIKSFYSAFVAWTVTVALLEIAAGSLYIGYWSIVSVVRRAVLG